MVHCIPNCLARLFSIVKPGVMALLFQMPVIKLESSFVSAPVQSIPNSAVLMPCYNGYMSLALLGRTISQVVKLLTAFKN